MLYIFVKFWIFLFEIKFCMICILNGMYKFGLYYKFKRKIFGLIVVRDRFYINICVCLLLDYKCFLFVFLVGI